MVTEEPRAGGNLDTIEYDAKIIKGIIFCIYIINCLIYLIVCYRMIFINN